MGAFHNAPIAFIKQSNSCLSVSWLDAQTIKNRVIARSEATWQSQKPALYQEIATPVCALVRNDMRFNYLFVKQKFYSI